MTTAAQIVAFGGVVGLGAMSPGPDFAVVVRRSAVSGRRLGMLAAAGVASGVFVWAVAAAAGLGAVVAAAPAALTAIRFAGAAYLAFLGFKALRSAFRPTRTGPPTSELPMSELPASGPQAVGPQTVGPQTAGRRAFRDGLLCNALNPKAAVFFVALLPQFVPAHPGLADTLTLSVVAVVITLLWFVTLANLVAAFRRLFAHAAARRAIDGCSGVALIGLGARLALTGAR
jgi:threonine/homoserine/homoserine lactone efflux protein